ncbi:MAG TPA: carboxypeptidase [Candidatus Scalindua sp.]|nr:carboxypeptidase [Candidatus Scalindua sp.]
MPKITKIVELIITTEKMGEGTENDLIRYVYQLFTKDGRLIAENDPEKKEKFVSDEITTLID